MDTMLKPYVDGLFWVPKSEGAKWAEAAVFKDRFGEPVNLMVEGCGSNEGMLGFPRTWQQEGMPTDARMEQGVAIKVGTIPAPRNQKQYDLVSEIELCLQSGYKGGQIVAPTGFGKTWVGCDLIQRVKRTTLVVTTKTDEMTNWVKHCNEMLGIEAQPWHGDTVPDEDCQIAVGLVQSIAKGPDRYGSAIYKRFGLVLFDESHRLGADFFVQACTHVPALYRFGMSATPERTDGREKVVEAHLGPVIAQAEGVPMIPKVFTAKSDFVLPHWKGKPTEPTLGKLSWVDKKLRKSLRRNELIVELIRQCHKRERNTIIFSNVKEHLTDLAAMTVEHIDPKDVGFYVGGMSSTQLENAANKPVIFATYQMAGQGTNYPWWDACIMATPLANVKQAIGRVLREYPDKKQPAIFDVIDSGTIWGAYARKRQKVYSEYGAEVTSLNV